MYRREQTRPVTGRRNWEEFFRVRNFGFVLKENVIKLASSARMYQDFFFVLGVSEIQI
jgi:hypothetical protein